MQTTTRKKIAVSVGGMVLAILLFFSAGLTLPVLDTTTDTYFEQAITRAGVAYATC